MLDNLKNRKVFLASNSPRRREIMKLLRVKFTSVSLEGIDESYPEDLPVLDVAQYVASKKSKAYLHRLGEGDIVITADTMVICDGEILGKPKDLDEARRMLRFLSGKTHLVSTGVVIADKKKSVAFTSISKVDFANLSDEEINYYVDDFHPLDKAGAYGIQEWIGAVAVKSIDGSFYNVMGLPIHPVYEALKGF